MRRLDDSCRITISLEGGPLRKLQKLLAKRELSFSGWVRLQIATELRKRGESVNQGAHRPKKRREK